MLKLNTANNLFPQLSSKHYLTKIISCENQKCPFQIEMLDFTLAKNSTFIKQYTVYKL